MAQIQKNHSKENNDRLWNDYQAIGFIVAVLLAILDYTRDSFKDGNRGCDRVQSKIPFHYRVEEDF